MSKNMELLFFLHVGSFSEIIVSTSIRLPTDVTSILLYSQLKFRRVYYHICYPFVSFPAAVDRAAVNTAEQMSVG